MNVPCSTVLPARMVKQAAATPALAASAAVAEVVSVRDLAEITPLAVTEARGGVLAGWRAVQQKDGWPLVEGRVERAVVRKVVEEVEWMQLSQGGYGGKAGSYSNSGGCGGAAADGIAQAIERIKSEAPKLLSMTNILSFIRGAAVLSDVVHRMVGMYDLPNAP